MKCKQRYCDRPLIPPRRKYCSYKCRVRETSYVGRDETILRNQKIKEEHESRYNKQKCKYCKNSDHEEFCCSDHELQYDLIMTPINAILGR